MTTYQDEKQAAGDKLRIAWAVLRLEWWLEWFGAPSKVYRPMRQELAANLRETAAEPGGVAAGVARLGSLKELAREAAQDNDRFRWERGLVVALVVLTVTASVALVLSLVFAGGLLAAGGGEGTLLGTEVGVRETEDALSFSFTFTWLLLPALPAAVAFVAVSRPWRYRQEHRKRS